MKKRGQITMFVILGIVIVAIVLLLLYSRTSVFVFQPTPENLNKVMSDIRKDILSCIVKVGDEPIRRMGLQGGYLSTPEGTYRFYDDNTISYLCYNMEEDPRCMNRMLRKVEMETALNEALDFGLGTCLDMKQYEKLGLQIQAAKDWEVETTINPESVIVKLIFPVTLSSEKSELTVSADTFTKTFDYPLGELYKVSQDIIDYETTYGEFDQLSYMLAYHGLYRIDKLRPYPDKIYKLTKQDKDYLFQFAIQGEPL